MAAIGSEQTACEGRNIVSVTVLFRMSSLCQALCVVLGHRKN